MPDEIPQSASEELKSELKGLSERLERLRIEAKKNAEEAKLITSSMAAIRRRMIEEKSAQTDKQSLSTPPAGPWVYP